MQAENRRPWLANFDAPAVADGPIEPHALIAVAQPRPTSISQIRLPWQETAAAVLTFRISLDSSFAGDTSCR